MNIRKMKKVTHKILTRGLYTRTISSFKFIRLYIWTITGSKFYLIVLVYKNITKKSKKKKVKARKSNSLLSRFL